MINDIGKKIKKLRVRKEMTLKDISEKTDLSIGFLSQFERGLTTIAIDSLQKISEILNVEISYFLTTPNKSKSEILRRHEREITHIEDSKFITYQISSDISDKDMLPRVIEILPGEWDEDIVAYQHDGEEFIYVLEGILTLNVNNEIKNLYPGDTAHFKSTNMHNWSNKTNKIVKILSVNTPNHFHLKE